MSTPAAEEDEVAVLKDPALAAFFAWLIPGLGHLYQGRLGKAALFFVCIMGLFSFGVYLGGNHDLGYGRVVYFAWQGDQRRLPYLCQIGVGLPALPALVQAVRMSNGQRVWFHGFMAPPLTRPQDQANADQPTPHDLHRALHRYFELGTVYTMIAGLLNILVIFDAWGGPVHVDLRPKRKRDDEAGEAPAGEPVTVPSADSHKAVTQATPAAAPEKHAPGDDPCGAPASDA